MSSPPRLRGRREEGAERMRASEYLSLTQVWTLCATNMLGRMCPWYNSVVTGKGLANHFLVMVQACSRAGVTGPTREPAPRPEQTAPFSKEDRHLAVDAAGGGASFSK